MISSEWELPVDRIAEVCRRYPVRKLSLFGSVLHGDATPNSDVDMLVEFEPEARVSLFDLVAMELDLTDLLNWKVDLNTAECLSRYFRDEVIADAEALYVKP